MTEKKSGQKDQTQVLLLRESESVPRSLLRSKKLSMQRLWLHLSKTMGAEEQTIFLAESQVQKVDLPSLLQEMEEQEHAS